MATPYFATEYTFSHLELEPELRSNVSMTYYEGGHMMYADEVCLAQMTADIEMKTPHARAFLAAWRELKAIPEGVPPDDFEPEPEPE